MLRKDDLSEERVRALTTQLSTNWNNGYREECGIPRAASSGPPKIENTKTGKTPWMARRSLTSFNFRGHVAKLSKNRIFRG